MNGSDVMTKIQLHAAQSASDYLRKCVPIHCIFTMNGNTQLKMDVLFLRIITAANFGDYYTVFEAVSPAPSSFKI